LDLIPSVLFTCSLNGLGSVVIGGADLIVAEGGKSLGLEAIAPGRGVGLTGFLRQPEAATVRTNPITNRFANLFSFIILSFVDGLI
jgi:hypothetical protein